MIKIKDKAKVTFRIEYDEHGVANVRTKARTKDICAILSCLIAHMKEERGYSATWDLLECYLKED